jgi:uncharacterized membrane protein
MSGTGLRPSVAQRAKEGPATRKKNMKWNRIWQGLKRFVYYIVLPILLGIAFFFLAFYTCRWTCSGLECLKCLFVIYLIPFFLLAGFFVFRTILVVVKRIKTQVWTISKGDKILTGITLGLALLIALAFITILK